MHTKWPIMIIITYCSLCLHKANLMELETCPIVVVVVVVQLLPDTICHLAEGDKKTTQL